MHYLYEKRVSYLVTETLAANALHSSQAGYPSQES